MKFAALQIQQLNSKKANENKEQNENHENAEPEKEKEIEDAKQLIKELTSNNGKILKIIFVTLNIILYKLNVFFF